MPDIKPAETEQMILVVLLHAYTSRPAKLFAVEQTVREAWPKAAIYCPRLPMRTFSMADPNKVVAKILSDIDQRVDEAESAGQPFQNIILVGHSVGGLLARKLYVIACGEGAEAPFETPFRENAAAVGSGLIPSRSWAPKVSRIVLLAGMNRGWSISHHLSFTNAFLWSLGALIGHALTLVLRRPPLIFTVRKGAEFITALRIQWLFLRRRAMASDGLGDALTIQLLGSRDDIVAPEDNVDLVSGGDFIYLDVPYSGHTDVIEMYDVLYGEGRKAAFRLALQGQPEVLREHAVVPSDESFSAPRMEIKQVIFVIHGIRDVGYWTHKIARRVKQRAGDKRGEWATETSTYGYFPMLPFLFPWYRRRKVEWLMDQYAEALARYPNASISYVGHSNGTYLLAKALEIYPCCHFKNVVFAGSVVRRNYDWRRLLDANPPRVGAVLNFVATSDWVVAFFPKFFQLTRLQDLGSAGHDGFVLSHPGSGIHQISYVKGGHGAAIQEPVWDLIADFVVTGEVPSDDVVDVRESRNRLVALLGKFPIAVWVILALAGTGIWFGIDWILRTILCDPTSVAFAKGVAVAGYALALWLMVTRL